MTISAYPLTWPLGWSRTQPTQRKRAAFGKKRFHEGISIGATIYAGKQPILVADARKRLLGELAMIRARDVVLSSNLTLNMDGTPRSGQVEPRDPGVAVYFKLGGKDRVLACDRWERAADNFAAVAKHIEAIRGIDRWGVGTIEQAFTGYTALPAPGAVAKRAWRDVLRPAAPPGGPWTREIADIAYRRLIAERHPDRGGTDEQAAELNAAIAEARQELGT